MGYTIAQERFLAIVPKITGGLGVPSAIFILSEVVYSHLRKEGNPILRAIAFVSFFEGLDAMAWFLSTWALPEGTFAFATGNQATCDFQGFFLQFVIGGPMHYCALALYFFLAARYGRTAEELAKVEQNINMVVFFYALTTSLILLALEQYNPLGAVCWVNGSPSGCSESTFDGVDSSHPDFEACSRGENAWMFGMILFYIPLWCCIVAIICLNLLIYRHIRDTGEAGWFATQSIMYGIAFCVTWAPSTAWSAKHWTDNSNSFALDFLSGFFEPLASFWNLLIFIRSRPASRKRLHRLLTLQWSSLWSEDEARPEQATSRQKARTTSSSSHSKGNSQSNEAAVIHMGSGEEHRPDPEDKEQEVFESEQEKAGDDDNM